MEYRDAIIAVILGLNARVVPVQLDPKPVRMPDRMVCNAATTDRSWKVAEPRCCETQFASFNEAMGGGGAGIHYSNHATVSDGVYQFMRIALRSSRHDNDVIFCLCDAILGQEEFSWSVARQVKS